MRLCLCFALIAVLSAAAWGMGPRVAVVPPEAAEEAAPRFRVERVVDGDTVDVRAAGGEVVRVPAIETDAPDHHQRGLMAPVLRVRVLDIDAPERGQPGGDEATAWVRAMLEEGEAVELVGDDRDRYGRRLAEIRHDGGADLAAGMVSAGHAWRWHGADRPDLDTLEAEARAARRGLWADPEAVDPSAWRKLSKAERDRIRATVAD